MSMMLLAFDEFAERHKSRDRSSFLFTVCGLGGRIAGENSAINRLVIAMLMAILTRHARLLHTALPFSVQDVFLPSFVNYSQSLVRTKRERLLTMQTISQNATEIVLKSPDSGEA
jgi:hypothetical protein